MAADYGKLALEKHREYRGKISVQSKVPLKTREDLSTFYTPGVAQPCLAIRDKPEEVYTYTSKWNTVAVVSDGSAVLGLGNIGAHAGIPVMEGKAILFKEFGGVDAFPLCVSTQQVDEIVRLIQNIEPCFGGINLEDVAAPRCFEIMEKLEQTMPIPVFHDDQDGTAIVVYAALLNACRVMDTSLADMKMVISGAGAAGIAIVKLLRALPPEETPRDIILVDTSGILYRGRKENMNPYKEAMTKITNKENKKGSLADALEGANVFVGVSAPNIVTKEMVATMEKDPVVLAMANPIPEINPAEAKAGGAKIVGTGRSDYPNQVNNVLAFPGVFRGALDARASKITMRMKHAAAYAIASCVKNPDEEHIVPSVFDRSVALAVANAVARAAKEEGVARV